MNTPGKASLPVIKRLPKYYRYLRTLKNDGITSISSRELAAQMGTTASQVRQDFNCIGDVNGRQGIGYSVENLLSILEHLLFGNGDLLPTILIGHHDPDGHDLIGISCLRVDHGEHGGSLPSQILNEI